MGGSGRHGSHLKLPASEVTTHSGDLSVPGRQGPPAPIIKNNPIFPGQSCFRFLVTLPGGASFPITPPEDHKQQLQMQSSSLGFQI